MGGVLDKQYNGKSALAELGSTTGGLQTVLLPVKIGKPLRCKDLRG